MGGFITPCVESLYIWENRLVLGEIFLPVSRLCQLSKLSLPVFFAPDPQEPGGPGNWWVNLPGGELPVPGAGCLEPGG